MKTNPLVGHIVFTTHWDREWVQTFEQYRFRLVNLMDQLIDVLETETSLTFVFDGQTVPIEDYLEIRPDQKSRVESLAKARRLIFGPWYVLGDQFLEGDEATVRNLLIGFKLCQDFGGPMLEGYVPDSFGSISTLPLILNGFGIYYANFGRGVHGFVPGDCGACLWQSDDGSQVLAFNRGYGNGIGLAYPELWKDIGRHTPHAESILANAQRILGEENRSCGGPFYVSVGIDHMEMRRGMSQWVSLLNQRTGVKWISSTPLDFARALEEDLRLKESSLPRRKGELRGSIASPMDLQGVLSTNRRVKRLNRLCEILLARVLEPLNVAQYAVTGQDYGDSITHAWKTVLKNHSHDSICACSTDATVRDVLLRFEHVLELYAISHERMLRNILGTSFADGGLQSPIAIALFNALPHRGVASFRLIVRVPLKLRGCAFSLQNSRGEQVGSAKTLCCRNIDLESFYATNADLQKLECKRALEDREASETYTLLETEGTYDFGSFVGWTFLELSPHEPIALTDRLTHGENWISNSQIKIVADPDGCIRIDDLTTDRVYKDLFWFEDTADIGDSYDHRSLSGDRPLNSLRKPDARIKTERNSQKVQLIVEVTLDIPKKSTGVGRSTERIATVIELSLTLWPSQDRVDATFRFLNGSINHRLRVGFSFIEQPRLFSGGHFTSVERNFGIGGDAYPCRPMTDYLHLEFVNSGFGLMTKGLYEFEPRRDVNGNEILVTLCRSTDSIGSAAGCNYPVVHAQELGIHEVEMALVLSRGLAHTIQESLNYTVPLVGEASVKCENLKLGSILTLGNPDIILSTLKLAEDRKGYIVRLYNPLRKCQNTSLHLHFPYANVQRVELSEAPSGKSGYYISGSRLELSFEPNEVMTLRFGSA